MAAQQRLSEKRVISELETGREKLLSAPAFRKLLSLLRSHLQSITRNLYIVKLVPEQAEEIYDILVDGRTVVHIEIPRAVNGDGIVVEKRDVQEYLRVQGKLSRPNRRKVELAIELAQKLR